MLKELPQGSYNGINLTWEVITQSPTLVDPYIFPLLLYLHENYPQLQINASCSGHNLQKLPFLSFQLKRDLFLYTYSFFFQTLFLLQNFIEVDKNFHRMYFTEGKIQNYRIQFPSIKQYHTTHAVFSAITIRCENTTHQDPLDTYHAFEQFIRRFLKRILQSINEKKIDNRFFRF